MNRRKDYNETSKNQLIESLSNRKHLNPPTMELLRICISTNHLLYLLNFFTYKSSFNSPTHYPRSTHSPLLLHPLTILGPPTHHPWSTHSSSLVHPLTILGPPTHQYCSTHSPSLVHPLTIFDPPTHQYHSTHSPSLVHPLTILGPPTTFNDYTIYAYQTQSQSVIC